MHKVSMKFAACFLAGALLFLPSCSSAVAEAQRAWIDVPLDGAQVDLPGEVIVHAHAHDDAGVAEMMLLVNGGAYRREPVRSPGADFTDVELAWAPLEPGYYTLQVEAFNRAGGSVRSAPVIVLVAGQGPEQTAMISQTATVLLTPSRTPLAPASPVTAVFVADSEQLTAGQCTMLRWQVENATAVSLDGAAVRSVDARQVCPQKTKTYRLRAEGPGGSVEKQVTIGVVQTAAITAVPDNKGPSISKVGVSPVSIWDGSSCGETSATVSAGVTDPSGVASVTLFYRAANGQAQGQWLQKSMSPAGGTYRATLGPADLAASLAAYGGGTVAYYVKAVDALDNTAQTKTFQFEAKLCFG
jgi:hypothetical protein